MSALSEASTPAQDNSPANALDAAHYGQHQLDSQLAHQHPQQQPTAPPTPANDQQSVKGKQRRSSPIPRSMSIVSVIIRIVDMFTASQSEELVLLAMQERPDVAR